MTGWHTGNVQAIAGIGKYGGAGLGIEHSTTDIYAEHRFRPGVRKAPYRGILPRRLGRCVAGFRTGIRRCYHGHFWVKHAGTRLAQGLGGAKIQNPFQQKIGEDLVPTVLRIGASWKASDIFLMTFETEKDLERKAMVKAGLEYRPSSALVFRAGMRSNQVARIGLGAGLRLKNNLAIDIASEWHPSLGLTPSLMVSWRKK